MNSRMNWTKGLLATVALATLGSLASVAIAGEVTEQNVAERIATMKTPQDHEEIAAFFKAQAAAEGEKVKEHEAMLASWKKSVSGHGLVTMTQHCQDAIAAHKKLQTDYDALAAAHEKMAKDASK